MLPHSITGTRFRALPIIRRVPSWCVWTILILLAAGAFLHLDADFPNHSRWIDDGAKFTDEGWWASGAIHHILTGRWLVPGDYNPMIAVPFWSALLEICFHFAGIHMGLARGVAFAFTIGTVLACGGLMKRDRRDLAPVLMLLVGTSPVLYFFSRLAVLEPALIFFLTATALAAYAVRPPGAWRAVLCGLLFTFAMLTKTSALFVAPAILYLYWFPHRQLWRSEAIADVAERARWIRSAAIAGTTFVIGYGLYWVLVVHTHPVDVHVFYHETKPILDRRSIEKTVRLVYRCFTWVDMILFPLAVAAVVLSVRKLRELWRDPVFGFAVLFFLGYSTFMVVHFDAEPHYFDVLVVPVMILVVLLVNALELRMPIVGKVVGGLVALAVLLNVGYIVRVIARPEYTFRDACMSIRSRIRSEPGASSLVVGHGAIETTLFTGVPALDDLGSLPLEQKIGLYRPGWALVWSDSLDVLSLPAVAESYSFTEVGKFPAFDNPNRGFLYLYRIRAR